MIDGGRFAVKRVVGETLRVEAEIFADGHGELVCLLLHRKQGDDRWSEQLMQNVEGDLWLSEFTTETLTTYIYTLEAWIDPFRTWRRDLPRWNDAGQNISAELQVGARHVEEAANRASDKDAERLRAIAARLSTGGSSPQLVQLALGEELAALMSAYPDRRYATRYRELAVTVDPPNAQFGAWYEAFPRSFAVEPGRHGTFRDCETTLLPYVAEMGFDILYLPPIHPIGRTNRKGKNNALTAEPGDPGSPWGIGSGEGGHKSIHPELGTMRDFHHFVSKAKEYGIDIALDVAFQCSPNHPYVKEHPEWFRRRPDGSIQYAENPPKRYEDIHPFNYDTPDRQALWDELRSIFTFWIEQGVNIFRVDNPHTKPFALWEWLIADVKRQYPQAIFLAEAFTRPTQRFELSKRGFTQSYIDFAWKNTKQEITDYLTEFTQTERKEYFRPNAWPNTPDILSDYVRTGGHPARAVRLVLAATLCASYGIYGPSFELGEVAPRTEPGSDEYQHSEKYEIKHWEVDRPDSLRPLITRVNRIRHDNAALHSNGNLRFLAIDNDQLVCYSKQTDPDNVIIVVVNLDPHRKQSGCLDLPIEEWGLPQNQTYLAEDLLNDKTYTWNGPRNSVELDPSVTAAHILRISTRSAQIGS